MNRLINPNFDEMNLNEYSTITIPHILNPRRRISNDVNAEFYDNELFLTRNFNRNNAHKK